MADGLASPSVLLPSPVLSLFVTIYRNSELEPVIFIVGDLRIVREVDIANGASRGRSSPTFGPLPEDQGTS